MGPEDCRARTIRLLRNGISISLMGMSSCSPSRTYLCIPTPITNIPITTPTTAPAKSCTRSFFAQTPFPGHIPPGNTLLSPPRSMTYLPYRRIGQASKVPAECVRMNHDLVREGIFSTKDIDILTSRNVRPPVPSLPPLPDSDTSGHYPFKHHSTPRAQNPSNRRDIPHLRPAVRPMRRGAPRPQLLHFRSPRPLLRRVQVDAPHLRRIAPHTRHPI